MSVVGYHEHMVDQVLLDRARELSIDDRLELIGALWDSIDHVKRGVSEATAMLIEGRLADADERPLEGRSWDAIKSDWHRMLR